MSGGWKPATFDLSAFAGKTVQLRFRYATDPATAGTDPTKPAGIFLDQIAVKAGDTVVFEDGAETAEGGWTATGFRRTTGTEKVAYDHYYIAAHRSYVSYDKYLKTGPYNIGWAKTKPDFAEHFPYQEGLLVTYWDTAFSDNDVSLHPGRGAISTSMPTRRRCTAVTASPGAPGCSCTTRLSASRRRTA